jgi:hypothetical protein
MSVEYWTNNMLKVRMWLVIATRFQARYLSFRLRTSSNTPSVETSVVIEFSSQLQWKGCFPSCNSRLEKHLGEPSQLKSRLQFGQLINLSKMNRELNFQPTSRYELRGARRSCRSFIRLQRFSPCEDVFEPTNNKGWIYRDIIWCSGVTEDEHMKACHLTGQVRI